MPKKSTKTKRNQLPLEDPEEEIAENEEQIESENSTLYDLLNVPKTATTEEIVLCFLLSSKEFRKNPTKL